MPEYIARVSYGKDSLKMLEVIHSRGLPLDRITTTDVWATETISANLPPVEAFKEQIDQKIWDLYRIEVEHLCARNKDGSKKTYEQMFYHVPNRRSQNVQVERERESKGRSTDSRFLESLGVNPHSNGMRSIECKELLPDSHQTPATTIVKNSRLSGTSITGFPVAIGATWCQCLKKVPTRIPSANLALVQKTQDRLCQDTLFGAAPYCEVRRQKYRRVSWHSCGRTQKIRSAER